MFKGGLRTLELSLFYFASDDTPNGADKYRLLIEGAKFADRHGFAAVWTPERHFHEFGGLYPNPSVTGAAVAALTERVGVRAGSVVLPLHNPIRVAEEWSVVDNLSGGRAGVSFASGWHADDFALAPDSYADRKKVMLEGIETVRKLWRGEPLSVRGALGDESQVRIHPRPVQKELPIWLTAAGHAETFRLAGELGAGLLTHLIWHDTAELARKIDVYREAWRRGGRAGRGHVTLMLHSFVGEDLDAVREKVRRPLSSYLKGSIGLARNLARSLGQGLRAEEVSERDMDDLLAHAFDRYFENAGLFGTPGMCLKVIERLKDAGVDEVACLIDFGVDYESVMESLRCLGRLRSELGPQCGGARPHEAPAVLV
jgi:natural product biosynthesis luciferase-like monooxygenase protein